MIRRRTVLFGGMCALATSASRAQVPPGPYAYIRGLDVARDFLSRGKLPVPDGRPDLWLRANFRNLGYYQGRAGWGIFIQHLILRTKGGPYQQWDTIPSSSHALLLVESGGNRVNRADGSIAGFAPPDDSAVELFISDDGSVATRHIPLELEVMTLDGRYVMNVASENFGDRKPL